MAAYVVDTNVLGVAEAVHHQVGSSCIRKCQGLLVSIRNGDAICIDNHSLILREYMHYFHGGNGATSRTGMGRAFYKWLRDNQKNKSANIQVVAITPSNKQKTEFKEFPRNPSLKSFHFQDRKFVAVAKACPLKPPIVHATDKGWKNFDSALKKSGVTVLHLCS